MVVFSAGKFDLFYIFLIWMLLWTCFRMPFHHKPLDNNLWRNFPLLLHTKQSRYARIEEYLWVRSTWRESMNDSLQATLTEAQMHCGHFGKTNRCEKPNSWRKAHNTSKSELAEQSAWLVQSERGLFSMETSLHPFTVVRIHKSQRVSLYLIRYFVQLGSVNIQTCWQLLSVYSALCCGWPDRPSFTAIPAENTSTCFGCCYIPI